MERAKRCSVARWVLVAVVSLGLATVWVGDASARKAQVPEFDAANFADGGGNPFPIDNKYWPLVPGTTFVYEAKGKGVEEEERNEVSVTYETRVVAGVKCVVVRDIAWEGDLIVESTADWYAQDKDGNVWYMGEDSESYEYDDEGNLIETSTEGSWEAGVDGAEAGILMLAKPRKGTSYRQEYYEGEAEDMAKVLKVKTKVTIGLGKLKNCLKTKEWTPLEKGVVEHKYYAPGVGLVLVKELKGKKTEELVEIIHFDP